MTTAAEHQFIYDTRCDACGQQAVCHATRAGGKQLQLCRHHEHISAPGLIAAGFIISDTTKVHV